MKNKGIYFWTIAGVLIVGLGCWLWFMQVGLFRWASQSKRVQPAMTNSSTATPTANLDPDDLSTTQKAEVIQGLNLVFTKLAAGSEDIHSASKYLQRAIDSHDESKIRQAFHRLYWSRLWKMSEVIPTLKGFLDSPDPLIRYLAAETLLKVGDQSGSNFLLALVQSPNPVIEDGQDIRVQAAITLGQFRQTDASQAVYALYQQTKDGELIAVLQKLDPDQVGSLITPKDYFDDPLAIRDYGLENVRQFLPQLTDAFQNSPKPDVKAAAAWSLATMTGDQNAINYLVQTAHLGLSGSSESGLLDVKALISYLGTIQTPAAKQTLEAALDNNNPDPSVARIAAVNLIFNQGGSDKVNQMVVGELTGSPNPLGVDLALNLANQLINDPQIQAAGDKYSRIDATGNWQTYTVERKNWPIYNWIDNYVIKLNNPPKTGP
jgi:HEAT repeat protein